MKSAQQWVEALSPLPEKEVLVQLIERIQREAFIRGFNMASDSALLSVDTAAEAWEIANARAT